MGADAEAGAGFVDCAQPVEIGAAQQGAGRFEGGGPGGRRDVDGQQVVGVLRRGVLAEEFGDGFRQAVVGLRRFRIGHFCSSPG